MAGNTIIHRVQELAGHLTAQLVEEANNDRLVTMVMRQLGMSLSALPYCPVEGRFGDKVIFLNYRACRAMVKKTFLYERHIILETVPDCLLAISPSAENDGNLE